MCTCFVGDAPKQYGHVITKCSKLWVAFLDTVMKVLRSHDPLDHMRICSISGRTDTVDQETDYARAEQKL